MYLEDYLRVMKPTNKKANEDLRQYCLIDNRVKEFRRTQDSLDASQFNAKSKLNEFNKPCIDIVDYVYIYLSS